MEEDFIMEPYLISFAGFGTMYISAILVERYYTSFWTGFMNIGAMVLVFVGLILQPNILISKIYLALGVISIIILIVLVLWAGQGIMSSGVIRLLGNSVFTSTICVGVVAASFLKGEWWMYLSMINLVGLILLKIRFGSFSVNPY